MVFALTHKPALRHEIILALVVKFLIIAVLWYVFFSEPVDEALDGPRVGDVLFGAASGDARHSGKPVIQQGEK